MNVIIILIDEFKEKWEALLLKSEEIAHKKIAKLNSKINRNLSKYLTQLLKGLSKWWNR